jgi:hypothetical protein
VFWSHGTKNVKSECEVFTTGQMFLALMNNLIVPAVFVCGRRSFSTFRKKEIATPGPNSSFAFKTPSTFVIWKYL